MIPKPLKPSLRYIVKYRYVKKHLKIGKNSKTLNNFGPKSFPIGITVYYLITRDMKFISHNSYISLLLNFYKKIKLEGLYCRYNLIWKNSHYQKYSDTVDDKDSCTVEVCKLFSNNGTPRQ